MKKTLKKMFNSSKKGIVFNSLSTHVDYKDRNLFYSNPEEILNFCVKNLSKYYVIRSDYQLKIIRYLLSIQCVLKENLINEKFFFAKNQNWK